MKKIEHADGTHEIVLESREEVDAFLDTIAAESGGPGTKAKPGQCTTCGGDATSFKDTLSRQEYRISGMCQSCQDSVFEAGEVDEAADVCQEPGFEETEERR